MSLDHWVDGCYIDVLFTCGEGSLVLSKVGLHTPNFLNSSLSEIQQEIFKKIVLVVHTYGERSFYLYWETRET